MMSLDKIYARRIFNSRYNTWDKTTDEIHSFCLKKKIDPYIFLAIFHIEGYFRPRWYRQAEYFLFKAKILKNPSLGPFQVRTTNLKGNPLSWINKSSMEYIDRLIGQCRLGDKKSKAHFIEFGLLYNLDGTYGKVLYELYTSLKREKWVFAITPPVV